MTTKQALTDIDSPDEFEDLTKDEQTILLNWCASVFTQIKTINTKHTSYGLKHIFENTPEGFYVSNGQFKGAMLKSGFISNNVETENNCYFNISEKSPILKKD